MPTRPLTFCVILSVLSLTIACDRKEQSASSTAAPTAVTPASPTPPAVNPEKQRLDRLAASVQAPITNLKAMRLRCQAGITPDEYRIKLGQLYDSLAGVDTPWNDDTTRLVKYLNDAAQQYNDAQEPWRQERVQNDLLERFMKLDGPNEPQDVKDTILTIQGDRGVAVRKKNSLWGMGNVYAEQAATLIAKMQANAESPE